MEHEMRKYIDTFKQKLTESENLNISDVSDSLYQDGSTRSENGLLDKMRKLFNSEKLTTWEYVAFKKMVRSFAKENNFLFDEEKEMLYKRR
jgi:hypothetical protein